MQAVDFRDECDALHAALAGAPAAAWTLPTQFKGWTFDDVLGHLHLFDCAAEQAVRGREQLLAFLGAIAAGRADGTSLTEFTRRWLQGCRGAALLERWHGYYRHLADVFRPLEPSVRVAWAGPDMSVRSLISARQMEVWSHGQAVFDALGVERVEHDRLRNIAIMGVNTFGWTFVVNGRDVPSLKPHVRLESPSGAAWEWNDAASAERIEGSAVDFCRVVTQTRNVADTSLRVSGAIATQWMAMAQCFAGPPEHPPAPGTRFMRR